MDREIQKEAWPKDFSQQLHRFVLDAYDNYSKPRQDGLGGTVSAIDIVTLDAIENNPGLTISRLASLLKRSVGTISLRIMQLESSGYIKKTKEDGNDRIVHLYETDLGRELVADYRAFESLMSNRILEKLSQHCSEQDIISFYNVLQIINQLMNSGELTL